MINYIHFPRLPECSFYFVIFKTKHFLARTGIHLKVIVLKFRPKTTFYGFVCIYIHQSPPSARLQV